MFPYSLCGGTQVCRNKWQSNLSENSDANTVFEPKYHLYPPHQDSNGAASSDMLLEVSAQKASQDRESEGWREKEQDVQ